MNIRSSTRPQTAKERRGQHANSPVDAPSLNLESIDCGPKAVISLAERDPYYCARAAARFGYSRT
jgi:hypothetical protein